MDEGHNRAGELCRLYNITANSAQHVKKMNKQGEKKANMNINWALFDDLDKCLGVTNAFLSRGMPSCARYATNAGLVG
jgi:hypothetical protein